MRIKLQKHLIATGISVALSSAAYGAVQQDHTAFQKADADGDGSLSYREAQLAFDIDQNRFQQIDLDDNQALSRAEFDEARITLRDQQQSSRTQLQKPVQGAAAGTSVQVKERPAEVSVTKPEPEITVQQKAPRIAVQQPPPEVEVQTPEPRVEVQQAEPKVTVVDTGKPQVEIKPAGEPQVITQQEPTQSTAQQDESSMQQRSGQQQSSPVAVQQRGTAEPSHAGGTLMSMRAGDLEGMEVTNRNDEDIGEVEKIVLDPQTNTLYAVVSVGGVLGIGDRKITMQLDKMQLRGDELIALTAMDEEELDNRPAYTAANYRELNSDQLLGATASAASSRSGTDSFARLDQDGNGHISRDEADMNPKLRSQWSRVDANNDQRIDRAEFSAFEQTSQ